MVDDDLARWATAAMCLGAAAAVAAATARRLRTAAATAFEAVVGAAAVGLFAPLLVAGWVWFLPLGPLEHLALTAALVLAGACWWSWRAPTPRWPTSVSARSLAEASLPAIGFTGVAGMAILATALKPVQEWDALMYHGPTVANLVTERSSFGFDNGTPFVAYTNLPAILGAAVVATTRSTRFLDLQQLPFAAVFFAVAWCWAGRGRPRLLAGAATLTLVAAPAFVVQLRTNVVDIAFGAATLVAVWGAHRWWSTREPAWAVVAAVGVGAQSATKPIGAVVSVVMVAVVVVASWWSRRRGANGPAPLHAVAAGVAGLAGGGAFYLRNAIEHGNPLYPIRVELGPVTLGGTVDSSTFVAGSTPEFDGAAPVLGFLRNMRLSITDPAEFYTWDTRVAGFVGIVWVLLGLALVAAVLSARRRWRATDLSRREVGFLLGAVVLVLVVQPQSWTPRYVFGVVALLVVLGVRSASAIDGRPVALLLAAVLLSSSVAMASAAERHADTGFSVIQRERRLWPGYGDTFSSGGVYGSLLADLRGVPCGTRVAAESHPEQVGFLSTFSLGLWGDHLCNDVRFYPGAPAAAEPPIAAAIERGTALVVFDQRHREALEAVAAERGLRLEEVGTAPELGGVVQVVARVVEGAG